MSRTTTVIADLHGNSLEYLKILRKTYKKEF